MFNKFILGKYKYINIFIGKAYHMIVDKELYSTKSKFNIAFANKLTYALFLNTALLT